MGPPAPADVPANLLPGPHELGCEVTIAVHICTSDGFKIELHGEKPSWDSYDGAFRGVSATNFGEFLTRQYMVESPPGTLVEVPLDLKEISYETKLGICT